MKEAFWWEMDKDGRELTLMAMDNFFETTAGRR
jgi:hypothetical protein